MVLFRIALVLAALSLASAANAYPATNSAQYKTQQSCTPNYVFPTAQAACSYVASAGGCGLTYQNPIYAIGDNGTATLGWCNGNAAGTGSNYQQWQKQAASYTCPNGGTLSGTTCTCPVGQTDTGTACVVACPAVGASMGSQSLTVGWALSPVPNAPDTVVNVSPSKIYGSQCVNSGGNMCSAVHDLDQPVTHCWRSQTASSGGLYRQSCDYPMKSSGTTCTAAADSPSNPAEPAASCPSGTVGTVNGKSVCLGTMPTTGINFGKSEVGGNPRAGTPTTDTNTTREPDTGAGGGPDARGGPGVTVGAGGNVGTGSNKTAGTGTGSNAPIQVEVEIDTCGLPGKPPCKIDETGTPTGAGAFAAADTAAQATENALKAVADTVVAGKSSTSWGFSIGLPTGCTNPPAFVLPHAGINYTFDMCAHETLIHAVMSFLWAWFTLTAILGMVRRTVGGG
jgi:hypothetical protein